MKKAEVKLSEAADPIAESRSLPIAEKGIKTDSDFAGMMSAIMSDVIEGKITPATANAAVNAGGKLLKVVEMRMKYGTRGDDQKKRLHLLEGVDSAPEALAAEG